MKQVKRSEKQIAITADEGYYLMRRGEPLCQCAGNREATVRADSINDWIEVPIDEVKEARAAVKAEEEYSQQVVSLIRRKYSADAETAIIRKYLALQSTPQPFSDSKADEIVAEFDSYNAYAEACKAEAKANPLTPEESPEP